MGIQKVVDSNMLRAPELDAFLSHSSTNLAVLTDYVAMEAYKGDDLTSIIRSMEVLAKFPRQVIVLKGTQAICGLKAKGTRLRQRMIDKDQTSHFPESCWALKQAAEGNAEVCRQILEFQKEANQHMERMLAEAADLPQALGDIESIFSAAEIKVLRTRQKYTDAMIEKNIKAILSLAAVFFRDHPRVHRTPSAYDLQFTYIFRFSMCALILALKWIEVGGIKNMRPDRIRNDTVDLSFATYATFFDGLLTADERANEIFLTAKFLLDALFCRG